MQCNYIQGAEPEVPRPRGTHFQVYSLEEDARLEALQEEAEALEDAVPQGVCPAQRPQRLVDGLQGVRLRVREQCPDKQLLRLFL